MIGIIGTGVMARGIALQAAQSGQDVVLVGRHAERLEACRADITYQLASLAVRYAHTASVQAGGAVPEIRAALDFADLSACEAVIEIVSEDMDAKRSVLQESERHIRDSCLLLTCTSSLSVSELARPLQRPGRFLGMHFFNPAHIMPLVEIVPHAGTEPGTTERAIALAARLGKRAILVRDRPGFFVNRVLFAYIQGFCTVLKDTADYGRVDEVMVRIGWPTGPAALLDAIGIDTCLDIGRILVQAFPATFSAAFLPVLEPLVRSGWTGSKSGRGFYRYPNADAGPAEREINRGAMDAIGRLQDDVGCTQATDEEIVERLMLPVTNEVFRCIEEGVVATPEDADQALFLAMGFGRRGGVCRLLKRTGVEAHIAKCAKYTGFGAIYRPPACLLAQASG